MLSLHLSNPVVRNRIRTRLPILFILAALLLAAFFLIGSGTLEAQAASTMVAYDMVGSTSQNLVSYTDDPAIPFSSPGDGFNKFMRGVSPTIPFSATLTSRFRPSITSMSGPSTTSPTMKACHWRFSTRTSPIPLSAPSRMRRARQREGSLSSTRTTRSYSAWSSMPIRT